MQVIMLTVHFLLGNGMSDSKNGNGDAYGCDVVFVRVAAYGLALDSLTMIIIPSLHHWNC